MILTRCWQADADFLCLQVNSSINNLIIGKIYIDHGGIMRIRSNSGLVARLKFHETGMLTREAHLVGPPTTTTTTTCSLALTSSPLGPAPAVLHSEGLSLWSTGCRAGPASEI